MDLTVHLAHGLLNSVTLTSRYVGKEPFQTLIEITQEQTDDSNPKIVGSIFLKYKHVETVIMSLGMTI